MNGILQSCSFYFSVVFDGFVSVVSVIAFQVLGLVSTGPKNCCLSPYHDRISVGRSCLHKTVLNRSNKSNCDYTLEFAFSSVLLVWGSGQL